MDDRSKPSVKPKPVKFFVALTFKRENHVGEVLSMVGARLSGLEIASERYRFDHTGYYDTEMRSPLLKQFFSFAGIGDPEYLVEMKLQAMQTERQFSDAGKRTINIDPGYMELPKIVVASSKNFPHRIYIGSGIYGDVQLMYQKRQFVPNPWTYPDYRDTVALSFFREVRERYHLQLKEYDAVSL